MPTPLRIARQIEKEQKEGKEEALSKEFEPRKLEGNKRKKKNKRVKKWNSKAKGVSVQE